jgi:tetratricopeptide (TPR) repeat protein
MADRLKGLQQRVSDEQTAARKTHLDVVLRLNRIEDPFEKNLYLGGAYAAAGDWRSSTEKLLEARRIGEGMIARRDVGRDFVPILGGVYGELLRNFTLLKEKKNAEALRNDGSRRFVNPDTKMEEAWWTQLLDWHSTWSETLLPQEEKKVARLRDEVKANPDDPQKIWALAQSSAEGVFSLFEARAYYSYLLENHPDFPQVQNGNCLHRLAEVLFACRDVREAIRRYRELGEMHRDHPKVTEPGSTGVKSRLEDCYKLLLKMGYPKDKAAK